MQCWELGHFVMCFWCWNEWSASVTSCQSMRIRVWSENVLHVLIKYAGWLLTATKLPHEQWLLFMGRPGRCSSRWTLESGVFDRDGILWMWFSVTTSHSSVASCHSHRPVASWKAAQNVCTNSEVSLKAECLRLFLHTCFLLTHNKRCLCQT